MRLNPKVAGLFAAGISPFVAFFLLLETDAGEPPVPPTSMEEVALSFPYAEQSPSPSPAPVPAAAPPEPAPPPAKRGAPPPAEPDPIAVEEPDYSPEDPEWMEQMQANTATDLLPPE